MLPFPLASRCLVWQMGDECLGSHRPDACNGAQPAALFLQFFVSAYMIKAGFLDHCDFGIEPGKMAF